MSPKNRLMFLLAAALSLAAYTPAIARPPEPLVPAVTTSATMPREVTSRANSESRMTTGAAPARPTPSDMNKTANPPADNTPAPGQQKMGHFEIQGLTSEFGQGKLESAIATKRGDNMGGCAKC